MTWQTTETGMVQMDGDRIVTQIVRTEAGFTVYDLGATNDTGTTPKVVGVLVSPDTERLDWLASSGIDGAGRYHGRGFKGITIRDIYGGFLGEGDTIRKAIDAAKEQR